MPSSDPGSVTVPLLVLVPFSVFCFFDLSAAFGTNNDHTFPNLVVVMLHSQNSASGTDQN